MEAKHTPGPWQFFEPGMYIATVTPDGCQGTLIADPAMGARGYPEEAANARLIAAAPEMLTVLERIRDSYPGYIPDFVEAVNAAIAKATGAKS